MPRTPLSTLSSRFGRPLWGALARAACAVGQGLRAAVCVGAVAALTACSALPVVERGAAGGEPGAAARGSDGPTVSGPQGPLSAARSRAVLAGLERAAGPTGIFERHLAVEQALAGGPLVAGNRARLLQDGPQTYQAMFAAMAAARDSINLETYILDDDEVGQRFVDALIAKQQAGVQVNLIYDGVGALATPAALFQRLRNAGVRTLEFNPVNPLATKVGWDINQRDHRKLLVVDGRTAFVGGINVSGVYSGGSLGRRKPVPAQGGGNGNSPGPGAKVPWRDTHLQIDGPVVAEFQKLFLATWAKQQGEPLAERNYFPPLSRQGNEVMRAIGTSPDDAQSLIYRTLLSAIHSAEAEVWLTNAYFVPDPQLMDALVGAAARGVDVRLVLPSHSDSALVFHAGRGHYDTLLRGGVKVFERLEALMHAKTAVIDGVWSTVGSTNLDWRSFMHNDEVNAVVLGADFGALMRAAFEADVARSKAITLQAWRRRPLSDRAKELFSRLWQYWL